MAQHPWRTQPASHRRSGPGQSAPGRWLGAARLRYLRLRRRGDRSRTARWLPPACVPAALAVVTARRRLGVSPAVALPVASMVPLAVAVTTPPGRWRYLAAGAAYMWVFKVTWELPYDDPEKLKQRLQVRYPVRIDSVLGGGEPPTLRLQRALRDPSRVSALDKAVTVVYGSWFVPSRAGVDLAAPSGVRPSGGRPAGGGLSPHDSLLLASPDCAAVVGIGVEG